MGSGSSPPVRVLGRYALHGEIASGGMATVHFARLLGVVGFAKTVAIKRLHPQLAKDPEFVSMFLDEARLAARIRHPNVVSTLDVVALHGELFLVMEYVQGESLRQLVRAAGREGTPMPASVVGTIMVGTLHGLHAAHEASSERGEPLEIVHRDVSPQNILVGIDGVPRVLDFGVAKAAGRVQTTRDGQLKGKLAYMSPEQLMGGRFVTRSTDVFAASIVLWEALAGRRLFAGESEGEVVKKVLDANVEPPSRFVPALPPGLDAIVLRGLARDPGQRFATAREMARALERALPLAPASDVGEYVERMAGPALTQRAEQIAEIESGSPSVKSAELAHGAMQSGSSWPSLVVAAPARPSSTVRTAPPESTVKLDAPPPPSPASSPALSERSSISRAIGAIVSDSGARASVLADDGGPTFLRLRRRVLGRIVLGSSVVAGALLLVAGGVALRDGREPAPLRPVGGASQASAEVVPPARSGSDPPPVPAVEPAPPSSASASALAAPSATPAAPPSPPAPNRVAAPRPPPRRAATACDPPFTVDADGFRHYKRECMR